ncbi:MAG: photosystem II stability/assembly factor-like uncharacterized protein [Saprospiraceae bacterium]|jgi:photosystem II stability/assembly factor-like uncharacterized protein
MKSLIIALILLISTTFVFGQVTPTLNDLAYRNIGPANQGGRIVDVEAQANDFTKVVMATASGGVWKSDNAGTTWDPIFDDYETASIGDIALDPNDNSTIWVGTGEANNRNSVSWGNGIYVSRDGGETFQNKGLESTHQIARVLVNPEDSDDICACAIGHLWGYSGERGLFQSKDGGNTWAKSTNGLPNDGKTGCTDIVRDAQNPNILYTAMYHRLRQPWTFHSGGEQGGIYKSIDNGKNWKRLTNGLPFLTGRIGLAIYQGDSNILMALVEAEKTGDLTKPGSGVYRSEDGGETWKYSNTYNNRPFYYSQIRINPSDDQRVYLLTTTYMKSDDGGNTFSNGSPDYEVHGDYHAMWIDPNNKDRYYLGADKGLSLSHDHGQSAILMDNLPIAQFYRINYDMQDPYYVYGGLQDNGSYATASFTRDARGILNDDNWKMHWGDGQDAVFNPYDYTDGYTSMEKGSYYKYNAKTREMSRISPTSLNTINFSEHIEDLPSNPESLRYNWSSPMVMSSHNPHHIYVGANHLFRSTDQGKTWRIISPDLTTNDPVKRQQGKSGGITMDNSGAEYHCAIHNISVSPMSEDVIWVGTDDGNVQCTMDGGLNWMNVRKNIPVVPEGLWVSRIEASRYDDQRAYVTFDGHRSDNFDTWVFVTEDGGKTWGKITDGFTNGETVRVIREDIENPNLLFAGTESGVWFTLDRGVNWNRLKLNMPTVSVYDIKIHPRDNDLIIGTHGRSIWVLDDISYLQQLSKGVADNPVHLYDQGMNTLWRNISRGGQRGHFLWAGDNPSTIINTSSKPRAAFKNAAAITYYVGQENQDSLTITISDMLGLNSKTIKVSGTPGVHRYIWNREFEAKPYSALQLEELTTILEDMVAAANHRRVSQAFQRFQDATDPYEKRKLLIPLTSGFLSYNINPQYLLPVANAGSYKISISNGTNTSISTLTIREDPMD